MLVYFTWKQNISWLLICFCWDIKPHTLHIYLFIYFVHTLQRLSVSLQPVCIKDITPDLQSCELLQELKGSLKCKADVFLSLDSSQCAGDWAGRRCLLVGGVLLWKKRKLKKTVQLSSLTWWRMCCFLFNHFTKCVYWFYHKTCLKNVKLKKECIIVNMLSEFSLINESYCSLLLELLNRKNVNYSVRLLMLTCTGYKLKYLHVLHFCVTCTDNLLINTDVGN